MLRNAKKIAVSYVFLWACLLSVFGEVVALAEAKLPIISSDGISVDRKGITKVDKDGDRILIQWGGEQVFMRSSFRLRLCEAELAPTFANLKSLVGKDCQVRYEEGGDGVEIAGVECSCQGE